MLNRRSLWVAVWVPAVLALQPAAVRADEPATASVAHIRLAGGLDETPVANDPLFGQLGENFKSKLDRIKKAKDDPAIQGLYLQVDGLAVGWGKLDELRRAVADFRAAGKKVYAFLEMGAAKDYLVAIACDQVCIPEAGWLMLTGLRGEVTFYKDMLGKIGIEADFLQMGDYKGASEPLTRSSMSPEFRKQLESVLDDYYEQSIVAAVARDRKLKAEDVKKLIDHAPLSAKQAKEAGLIDQVAYADDFRAAIQKELKAETLRVRKNYGQAKMDLDLSNPFAIFKLLAPQVMTSSSKPKVAVIYAVGPIMPGKGGQDLFGGNTVGSTTTIEAIRQAEQDKTVKAIVLRVDSPGGSALASDLIWNELKQCKKPVVASMGDVAASGGYYISMAARKIYAEPGTLTGSIGVVGGKLVIGGLEKKIGLNTEIIQRGTNAGIFSTTTPFSESERKALHGLMKDTYEQFVDKAIQGREKAGKKIAKPDFLKLAEGRVWTGRQAKANGLVDELGTLADAIAAAQDMAGAGKDELELLILPRPKTFFEQLAESKADAELMGPRLGKLPLIDELPELRNQLRQASSILRLQGEPVWAIIPHRIELK